MLHSAKSCARSIEMPSARLGRRRQVSLASNDLGYPFGMKNKKNMTFRVHNPNHTLSFLWSGHREKEKQEKKEEEEKEEETKRFCPPNSAPLKPPQSRSGPRFNSAGRSLRSGRSPELGARNSRGRWWSGSRGAAQWPRSLASTRRGTGAWLSSA